MRHKQNTTILWWIIFWGELQPSIQRRCNIFAEYSGQNRSSGKTRKKKKASFVPVPPRARTLIESVGYDKTAAAACAYPSSPTVSPLQQMKETHRLHHLNNTKLRTGGQLALVRTTLQTHLPLCPNHLPPLLPPPPPPSP